MKKVIALLSISLLTLTAIIAKPVSPERAITVAQRFFPGQQMTIVDMDGLYLVTPDVGAGFVLVATDDCVRPVLAHSSSAFFPVNGMPAHVAKWIDGYRREIASLVAAGAIPSPEVQAQWSLGGPSPKSGITPVAPLMTTTWGQKPYYNLLCPYDEQDSAYSVVGCTATATAQVMKYWNHPEVGWGSHGYYHDDYGYLYAQFDTTHYRWNLMPNSLDALSDSAAMMAVAELMYHVGVAVEMEYSPSSSGAWANSFGISDLPCAENALKTYFKYSPMLSSIYKDEHSDSDWDAMILAEIEAARPVLYIGYDTVGGHTFVLDGVDSIGMFHVNWGWRGSYDGYYTLDSLSPGAGGIGGNATYTFNTDNSAVIGIQPSFASNESTAVIDIRYDSTKGTVMGNGTYALYNDTVTIAAKAAEGYRFIRWQSGSIDNPKCVFVNGDIHDSALFEPMLPSDTVSYCNNWLNTRWHDDYCDTTEWGIRIPEGVRQGNRCLMKVQYFPVELGSMTLNIYFGNTIDESNPVYTAVLHNDNPDSLYYWRTYELDYPLAVPNNAVVWVTLRAVGGGFPAATSNYSGCSDGSWYRLPEGWRRYDEYGHYFSWMLNAVFQERIPLHVVASPNNIDYGNISGMGTYLLGETVVMIAQPQEGYQFSHWSNGSTENPFVFVISRDTMFIGYFESVNGISGIEHDDIAFAVEGRTVTVDAPEGVGVAFYDMQGRCLARNRRFTAHAAGVYLLRIGEHTAKIVLQ